MAEYDPLAGKTKAERDNLVARFSDPISTSKAIENMTEPELTRSDRIAEAHQKAANGDWSVYNEVFGTNHK